MKRKRKKSRRVEKPLLPSLRAERVHGHVWDLLRKGLRGGASTTHRMDGALVRSTSGAATSDAPLQYRGLSLKGSSRHQGQGLVLGIEYRRLRLDSCSPNRCSDAVAAGNEMCGV
jgi:hypothetical protein